MKDSAEPQKLKRALRTTDVALLTVGGVIGSGIFLVPGEVLTAAGGSVTLALSAWVMGGVIALFGALTFAELGARRPEAGGLYIFIRDAFGRGPAFLFGLSIFVAWCGGVNAALCVAFGDTIQTIFGLSAFEGKAWAVAGIVIITVLNLVTAHAAAMVQNVTTMLRIGVLLAFASLAFGAIAAPSDLTAVAAPIGGVAPLSAVVSALVGVFWAYEGWQGSTYSTGEMRDPGRVLPRGIGIGVAILIILYVLVNIGLLHVLGVPGMMASKQAMADALTLIGYPGLSRALLLFVGLSVLAAAHATLFTGARVIYAMALDGLFIRSFAQVSTKTQVPSPAIIGGAAIAVLFALTNSFGELLSFVVVFNWMFYTLAASSLFIIRRLDGAQSPSFRVPLYPVIPLAFVLAGGGIVVASWLTGPASARYGLIITVAGWAAYTIYGRFIAVRPTPSTSGDAL